MNNNETRNCNMSKQRIFVVEKKHFAFKLLTMLIIVWLPGIIARLLVTEEDERVELSPAIQCYK